LIAHASDRRLPDVPVGILGGGAREQNAILRLGHRVATHAKIRIFHRHASDEPLIMEAPHRFAASARVGVLRRDASDGLPVV
jgi:hypothetical protein